MSRSSMSHFKKPNRPFLSASLPIYRPYNRNPRQTVKIYLVHDMFTEFLCGHTKRKFIYVMLIHNHPYVPSPLFLAFYFSGSENNYLTHLLDVADNIIEEKIEAERRCKQPMTFPSQLMSVLIIVIDVE